MKASILIRNGSIFRLKDISGWSPWSSSGVAHDSAVSYSRRSKSTKLSLDLRGTSSPDGQTNQKPLRRVRSDTDLNISAPPHRYSARWSLPAMLAEAEEDDLVGSVSSPVAVEEEEEKEYSGGGMGNGRKSVWGFGGGGGESGGDRRIGNYYQEKLRADPGNPLLLRNYGRFLHEVEGDLKKAEEYYGRAILASPDDGELLSLYGRLLWESRRDCVRADAYYERAMEVSPDDWFMESSVGRHLPADTLFSKLLLPISICLRRRHLLCRHFYAEEFCLCRQVCSVSHCIPTSRIPPGAINSVRVIVRFPWRLSLMKLIEELNLALNPKKQNLKSPFCEFKTNAGFCFPAAAAKAKR